MLLAGCGIDFGNGPQGNDFFTSLRVSGAMRTGAPLTAAVSYETFYPEQLEIRCELRQGSKTLRDIGGGQTPAVTPERHPDDDAVPGNFSIDFTVDEPGDYKVECFTTKDATTRDGERIPTNFIIEEFSVAAS